MKLADCKKGQRVMYIPEHARSDPQHSDCECGVISSVGNMFVYVKYDNGEQKMVNGDEPYTAQATDPDDLMVI